MSNVKEIARNNNINNNNNVIIMVMKIMWKSNVILIMWK
jgi:hypothetical protein